MPSHSFHSEKLLKNVSVDVIYENNPVFAGENVSVIVRFKHLGESKDKDNEVLEPEIGNSNDVANSSVGNGNGSIRENEETTQETTQEASANQEANQEWFGKRLSVQLSNSARSLFLDEFNSDTKENEFNKPIDLFSGYVQLSGIFTYDNTVIDSDKFDQIHKKTTVSGKIGGLQGLEVSKQENAGGFFNILSGIFGSDIDSMVQDGGDSNKPKPFDVNKNLIPFFSTNQSLLFSLINLKPNTVKSFYVNFKLPAFLPSTYHGNSINLNYKLIIGSSIDAKSGLPKPLVINFPLHISSFFNEEGYQPIYDLNKFILLQSDKSFVEEIEDKISFKHLKKQINYNSLIEDLSLDDKRDIFLKKIKDLQINDDNNENTIDNFKKSKVKDNIAQFSELLANSQSQNNSNSDENDEQSYNGRKLIQIDGFTYEKQVNKFQTQYLINRNGKFVTSLTLSKPFYKIGTSAKLHFNFKSNDQNIESEKVTGILITLENLELINQEYSVSEKLISNNHSENVVHFRESFSTFNASEFSVNIPIPINATAQFKTNIFENKWALVLKFIMSTEPTFSMDAHNDKLGTLTFATDSLGGAEFNCRLPLHVIPSDQEFGGIPLS